MIDTHTRPSNTDLPSYAQVVGAVNRQAGEKDRVLTAAGGLPGELHQELEGEIAGDLRLRVRLLLHGL